MPLPAPLAYRYSDDDKLLLAVLADSGLDDRDPTGFDAEQLLRDRSQAAVSSVRRTSPKDLVVAVYDLSGAAAVARVLLEDLHLDPVIRLRRPTAGADQGRRWEVVFVAPRWMPCSQPRCEEQVAVPPDVSPGAVACRPTHEPF